MGSFSSGLMKTNETREFLDFDYPKRLKMKGLNGLIYEKYSQAITSPSIYQQTISSRIAQLKSFIQQKTLSLYGKNHIAGLVLGMLIGDRSEIPEDAYQMYIDSGLVHLIAVSGGNVVMLTLFISALFFFIPFYLRTGLIILTIIFYGILCGGDSSVVRAVLMGSLSLFALFRGKEIPIRRLLSGVFVIMLLINPYYLVYDVGFLMSFAAVIGTVRSGQRTFQKDKEDLDPTNSPSQSKKLLKKGSFYIRKNYIQASIGASVGVFPVLMFFMEKMNFLSLLGNLLVLPIVPFVMIYGGISLIAYHLTGW
ncbi:MAG: ComEC/Rec2 family competence protein [bacterium]